MPTKISLSSAKLPCIIYTRVSSTKQSKEGSGLSSQERSCRDYAERMGYDVVEVFTDIISGRHADRPGMNALLKSLRTSHPDGCVVVVDDISRFARDVSTHATLRDKVTATGAKIESPNQRFGEDAGDRFIETVMAAIAEHERRRIAEQSRRRSIARMRNGFWALRTTPIGYKFDKHRGGGKILVPEQPLANIVKDALEGFAAGRLGSQGEVKRFLESKPEFPRGRKNSEVHWDKVKRMLTDVLYAGYLEYPRWNIPLTPAQHEPLVTLATFQIIQQRLNEGANAPARKDIHMDFPLRGFLKCESCGHPLTSCWSKSRSGKKYPYYLCQYRGCSEKGKSSSKVDVENEFEDHLKRLVPTPETFELAETVFRSAWEEKNCSVNAEAKRLRAKARQVELDVEKYLERLVRTDNEKMIFAYEARISELEHERARLEEAAQNARPEKTFDEMFEHSMRFLSNPYEIWKNGDFEAKRTVLKLVLSEPLVFNRKTGVRTAETSPPFKALGLLQSSQGAVVTPAGFEPATCPLGGGCSIQLSHGAVQSPLYLCFFGLSLGLLWVCCGRAEQL